MIKIINEIVDLTCNITEGLMYLKNEIDEMKIDEDKKIIYYRIILNSLQNISFSTFEILNKLKKDKN